MNREVGIFGPIVSPQALLMGSRQTEFGLRCGIRTAGEKPCFLSSLRISFTAAVLSRRRAAPHAASARRFKTTCGDGLLFEQIGILHRPPSARVESRFVVFCTPPNVENDDAVPIPFKRSFNCHSSSPSRVLA